MKRAGALAAVALGALLQGCTPPAASPTPVAVPVLKPRRALAVLGFRNLAGRPDADWISVALAETLTSGLAAGGQLRTISGEDVARTKLDLGLRDLERLPPEMLAKARQNLGADLFVLGAYQVALSKPGAIRLDLLVQDATTGATVAEVSETGSRAALAEVFAAAEARLREALKLSAPPERRLGGSTSLPSTPETARLYSEGLACLRRFDALAARALLDQAVAADPSYPMAHAALAEAWSALGYDARARAEAEKAFSLAEGLPLQERLAIEGRYRETAGQWDKAVETYGTLARLFPDDLDYALRLAAALTSAGKRKEALATLDTLRARLPAPLSEDPRIDLEEARAANALGAFIRGQAAAARGADKGEAQGARQVVARARLLEGYSLRALGEPAKAAAVDDEAKRISAAAGDRRGVSRALLETASVLRYQGELEKSLRLAREALATSREIGDQYGMTSAQGRIASVLAEQGSLAEARRIFGLTLEMWRETGDKSGEGTALNNIGESLWKMGALPEARRRLEQAVSLFRGIGSRRGTAFSLFNLGFVLLDQGELAEAQQRQEESLALSRAIGELSLAAVALQGLGQTQMARGELASARRSFEEALRIRIGHSERGRAAETTLALAALELEEGRLPEAEASARVAIQEFALQKAPHYEAQALAVLGRTLGSRQGRRSPGERRPCVVPGRADRVSAGAHRGPDRRGAGARRRRPAGRGDQGAEGRPRGNAAGRLHRAPTRSAPGPG